MSASQVKMGDRALQTSLSFLQNLFSNYQPRNFAVRFWDGTTWSAESQQPVRFTLVLKHPGAVRKMFWPPNELTLGAAYIYDDFDIEGDMEAVFALEDYLTALRWEGTEEWMRSGEQLLSLPFSERPRAGRQAARLSGALHSKERDRQAVTYHYDVSNDFYALWLDSRMIYSCAYFSASDDDLEVAQERKLEYICRKLRLRCGQRLLDIGCGWGGLVIHAARHYGVRALGITLSEPQAELANERIRQAGLTDHCRVEVCDYRDIDEPMGYDKLVSVEMHEHVGESRLLDYLERAWRLLRPGGVFLNQGITCSLTQPVQHCPSFSDRYVFPDGELVPISTALRNAEIAGFEIRDVESLREHYVPTLRHMVRRLELCHDEVCRITDEVTYRVWRLYLSGAVYRFRTGLFNVYQMLLAKPDPGKSGLPRTRADWYA